MAYEMGLRPWEFWRTTPAELEGLYRGYQRRLERQWDVAAWLVCYLLRPHVKRSTASSLTPKKLLGRELGATRTRGRRVVRDEEE